MLTIDFACVTNRHHRKRVKCHPLGLNVNFKAAFSCKQLLIIHLESQRQRGMKLYKPWQDTGYRCWIVFIMLV